MLCWELGKAPAWKRLHKSQTIISSEKPLSVMIKKRKRLGKTHQRVTARVLKGKILIIFVWILSYTRLKMCGVSWVATRRGVYLKTTESDSKASVWFILVAGLER